MKLARESWIIAAIGVVDLISTLYWVHNHGAMEANPIFSRYLSLGYGWFALMKLLFLAGPILILEMARRQRPHFTRRASQFAIFAYLLMYGMGVLNLNPGLLRPADAARESADAPAIAAPDYRLTPSGIEPLDKSGARSPLDLHASL